MLKNNLFYQRIYILTGEKINLESTGLIVNIPPRYGPLFGKKQEEQDIDLNEVANLVHNILSRKEEFGNANLDKWGRFDHDKSFLVQNGLDQSPIIDELILDVIKQLNLKVGNIWPEGKKAAVCLTHDVDSIDGFSYFWLRKMNWYWHCFRARIGANHQEADKWISTLKKWKRYKGNNFDPMDSFDQIQKLEDSYGFRSTFFFMSLRHGLSREGRRYSVKNPRVAEVSKKLLEGGWEIGLHAAYHNHLSLSSLKEQKQRLEEVIKEEISGCRHHYLRVRFPQSWMLYAQAGIDYSSNIAWGGKFNGFRAGTCLPYQPLEGEYSLWEIPFQLMDANTILNPEDYSTTFSKYLKHTKTVGGCLVINFHQEHLHELVAPGVGVVYRKILEIIAKDEDVTVLTMNEVCKIMNQAVELT